MIQKINNALVPISATLKLQCSLIFMMIELPNHFIFIFHHIGIFLSYPAPVANFDQFLLKVFYDDLVPKQLFSGNFNSPFFLIQCINGLVNLCPFRKGIIIVKY